MSHTATQADKPKSPANRLARAKKVLAPAKKLYSGSFAEQLWNRLMSLDFISMRMLFAAVLLLCAFPFFIVVNALFGHSATAGLARRLGLNQHAAADVSHIFAPANSTTAAVDTRPKSQV